MSAWRTKGAAGQHRSSTNATSSVALYNDQHLEAIRVLVRDKSGLFYGEHNVSSLTDAIEKRMAASGYRTASEYYEALTTSKARYKEFTDLVNLLTIQHTRFFRNPALFRAFRDTVLPEVIRAKAVAGDNSLNILSAGCATGEEPYSIAMMILEVIGQPSPLRARILATDISREALEAASQGVYAQRSIERIEEEFLRGYIKRFCSIHDGEVRVKDSVKDLVEFQYMNLTDPFAFPRFDMIFCRNVTIYFDLETVRRVFDKLCDSLPVGGYLFVGGTESLQGITSKFELVESARALYYRKLPVNTPGDAAGVRSSEELGTPEPNAFLSASPTVHQVDLNSGAPAADGKIKSFAYAGPNGKKGEANRTREQTSGQSKDAGTSDSETTVKPDQSSEDPERLVETALELFDQEKPLEALTLAQRACELKPNLETGRLLIARISLNSAQFGEAEKECRRILKESPSSSEAHYLLGVAYQKMGKQKLARESLQKSIYLDTDHPLAHFALAESHATAGEHEKAARAYRNTLKALEVASEERVKSGSTTITKRTLAQLCAKKLSDVTNG